MAGAHPPAHHQDYTWMKEKEKFLKLSFIAKRKNCVNTSELQSLDDIETWDTHLKTKRTVKVHEVFPRKELFNRKVSLCVCDITHLEVDAIVNVAGPDMIHGGAVCYSIHNAAGIHLSSECMDKGFCEIGEANVTGGYKLPAKYVIHTVGPTESEESILQSCYFNCLKRAVENGLQSIAFPFLTAGVKHAKLFSPEKAAEIAVLSVRKWLEQFDSLYKVKRIIFCIYDVADMGVYVTQMCRYFPGNASESGGAASGGATGFTSDSHHGTKSVGSVGAPSPQQPQRPGRDRSLAVEVKVHNFPDGYVGYPVVFFVDAIGGGAGKLDVRVNGPSNTRAETDVDPISPDCFRVSFTPRGAAMHNVYIVYNDIQVPGCPYSCNVEVENTMTASWNAPILLEINKATRFTMTSTIGQVPFITVKDGRENAVKSFMININGGLVDITPTQEGVFWIYVTVGRKSVPGSPFACRVWNSSNKTGQHSKPATSKPATKQQNGQIAGPAGAKVIKYTTPTHWKKGKRLGVGGFGEVFLCYDEDTGRELAVKQIPLDQKNSKLQQEMDAVRAEVKLLRDLKHDRIVQYVGFKEDNINMVFSIFMEYMPGGSVMDQIKTYGILTEKVAGYYTRQVLEGLEYLHDYNIIHRDIKSGNILRDTWANVKLADFGCSKEVGRNQMHTVGVGTFNWMSPEILSGSYNHKTDIWSLGCTVVEMMTGKPPWHDTTAVATLVNKITKSDKVEYKLKKNASSSLKDFLDQCFKKNRDERPEARILQTLDFCKQQSRDRSFGTPV